MKILVIALGIVFGAAEFLLTKVVAERALKEQKFMLPLVGKLLSYGAVIALVLSGIVTDYVMPFGISAGGALLVTGLSVFIYHIVKEKR